VVIAAHASRQHGLVRLAQLPAAGLDYSAVSARVRAGRLHRRCRRVYSVGHAALSREAELLAAVFLAGEGAALSHLAVAGLAVPRSLIDVVTPKQRRAEPGMRVTSMPRLFVDLSDVLTPHELANVIHEAAFKGWFSEPATRDAMHRANGRHDLRVLRRRWSSTRPGAPASRAATEAVFLSMLKRLPEPLVNPKFRREEIDFRWPEANLAVEIDGAQHSRPRTQHEDAQRQAKLAAAGYTVLRFGDHGLERATAVTERHRRLARPFPASTPRPT
jgi:hypothetical protein